MGLEGVAIARGCGRMRGAWRNSAFGFFVESSLPIWCLFLDESETCILNETQICTYMGRWLQGAFLLAFILLLLLRFYGS